MTPGAEFQKDGLRLFRPSKAERKRIEDIVVYDEEGLRVDTFGEICDLILRAQNEYNVVHDKGTQLPIASTEVQVILKEGAKKVTAGFNQNDLAPAVKQLIQKKNDWVLMYKPPVSHRTVKRPRAVPRKFQDRTEFLEGKANSKGEIKVLHSRRGWQVDMQKSRLVLYNPWSYQLLDTADDSMVPGYDIRSRAQQQQAPSEEVDSKFAYREGDDVKCGEFIIIAVDCDAVHKKPFLIAKIYELGHADGEDAVTADGITYRSVKARIYGNTNDDPTKVHRPGWVDKSNRPYFRVKPEHPSHVPYTTVISHGDITTYSVILAGFEIDEASEKIPSRVLEALEELWEK